MTPHVTLATTEPTHPCARCGAPVGQGVGLCERCNPLGLRDSAASQVHGSVFIAVTAAVIVLAVFARLAIAGVGPFPATLDSVEAVPEGLVVTMTVRNEGTGAGQTTCQVSVDDRSGRRSVVLTPRLDPGEAQTFQRTITELGSTSRPLRIQCRTP